VTDDELRARARAIMRRPYRKVIRGDPEEGYLAEAPELPGCMTAGETESEALTNLHEAMMGWLMTALAHDLPIPEPEHMQQAR
jgi:antitoxin HicB